MFLMLKNKIFPSDLLEDFAISCKILKGMSRIQSTNFQLPVSCVCVCVCVCVKHYKVQVDIMSAETLLSPQQTFPPFPLIVNLNCHFLTFSCQR